MNSSKIRGRGASRCEQNRHSPVCDADGVTGFGVRGSGAPRPAWQRDLLESYAKLADAYRKSNEIGRRGGR